MKKKIEDASLKMKHDRAVIATAVGAILTVVGIVGLFFSSWATIPLVAGGIALGHSGTVWADYAWEKEQRENN